MLCTRHRHPWGANYREGGLEEDLEVLKMEEESVGRHVYSLLTQTLCGLLTVDVGGFDRRYALSANRA